jgi:hypothetical protein
MNSVLFKRLILSQFLLVILGILTTNTFIGINDIDVEGVFKSFAGAAISYTK